MNQMFGTPDRPPTAQERMDKVARLAPRLTQMRNEGLNYATIRAMEAIYAEAVREYTNPFNVDKYQR